MDKRRGNGSRRVAQQLSALADTASVASATFTWRDLPADAGVLELDERVTPPGLVLELHVVRIRKPAVPWRGGRPTEVNGSAAWKQESSDARASRRQNAQR